MAKSKREVKAAASSKKEPRTGSQFPPLCRPTPKRFGERSRATTITSFFKGKNTQARETNNTVAPKTKQKRTCASRNLRRTAAPSRSEAVLRGRVEAYRDAVAPIVETAVKYALKRRRQRADRLRLLRVAQKAKANATQPSAPPRPIVGVGAALVRPAPARGTVAWGKQPAAASSKGFTAVTASDLLKSGEYDDDDYASESDADCGDSSSDESFTIHRSVGNKGKRKLGRGRGGSIAKRGRGARGGKFVHPVSITRDTVGATKAATAAAAVVVPRGVLPGKRPANEGFSLAQVGAGAKRVNSRAALLESLRHSSSQIKKTETGRLDVINMLKKMQMNAGGDSETAETRRENIAKLREKLAASNAAAPMLDAGHLQSALARNLELGQFHPLALPTVTRAYEESMMTEADTKAGQRPCFNMENCESFKMALAKGVPAFVMREFLYPEQLEAFNANQSLPVVAFECLLCRRLATVMHYVQLKLDGEDAKVMIASHWNLCDREGEYNPDVMFMPPGNRFMGIIQPVFRHDRDLYTFEFDVGGSGLARVAHTDAVNFRIASAE